MQLPVLGEAVHARTSVKKTTYPHSRLEIIKAFMRVRFILTPDCFAAGLDAPTARQRLPFERDISDKLLEIANEFV